MNCRFTEREVQMVLAKKMLSFTHKENENLNHHEILFSQQIDQDQNIW